MKKLSVVEKDNCAGCQSCEIACAQAFYKEQNPEYACLHFTDLGNGKFRNLTCVQCGKCARVCPQQAITKNPKGVYMVNKNLCISCGECVRQCPFHVMVLVPGHTASKCIACGLCVRACPLSLLEVQEK